MEVLGVEPQALCTLKYVLCYCTAPPPVNIILHVGLFHLIDFHKLM